MSDKGDLAILWRFFKRDGVDTLKTFAEELKALSPEETKELAQMVAEYQARQTAGA